MKINGWDISEADARQWNVTPDFCSINNDSEWTSGSLTPEITKNKIGFKLLKIVLLIKTGNRQKNLERCSKILSYLLDPVELELDGFEHKFYGILKKSTHTETVMNRWHTLTLEFECYEYGDEISFNFDGTHEKTMTINNPGNILTPAKISVLPTVGVSALTIKGISRNIVTDEAYDIVIRDTGTDEIILDGETGLITQNGELKAGDVEIWELPSLKPGENVIELDCSGMNVTVSFRPRYM